MNYRNFIIKNNIRIENAFDYLYKNFIPTIADHSYLVDWKRVNENRRRYNILLNLLNSLLNLEEEVFKKDFEALLREYPQVVEAFPILLASRENRLNFIDNYATLEVKKYIFKKPNLLNIDIINHYYAFFEKTGLKKLFCNEGVKNLVDYVFGVEVGLNSNARKNRTGKSMEDIILSYLSDFCKDNKEYQLIEQATPKRIKEFFDYELKIDKNRRRFDFALYHKKKNKLYLIEVNFYTSGGSKLKATAGEYKGLNDFLKSQGVEFIWITDGKGWLTALNPLEETFNHNNYVVNLDMIKRGVLKEICLVK